jgi:hypothetical protein
MNNFTVFNADIVEKFNFFIDINPVSVYNIRDVIHNEVILIFV